MAMTTVESTLQPRCSTAGTADRVVMAIVHSVAAGGLVLLWWSPVLVLLDRVRPVAGLLLILGGVLGLVLHSWCLPRHAGMRWRANLGFRAMDRATVPWILAAAVSFQAYQFLAVSLAAGLGAGGPHPPTTYAHASEPLGWLVVSLSAALYAPLAEELAIRGYLQHKLGRSIGKGGALALVTCLFGTLHGSLTWAPFFMLGGLVFGCAMLATRSVWASVVLHAAANSVTAFPWSAAAAGAHPAGAAAWLLAPLFALVTLLLIYGAYRSRLRTRRGGSRGSALGRDCTLRQPDRADAPEAPHAPHHHCS